MMLKEGTPTQKQKLIFDMRQKAKYCVERIIFIAHYYKGKSYEDLMLTSLNELDFIEEFLEKAVFNVGNDKLL